MRMARQHQSHSTRETDSPVTLLLSAALLSLSFLSAAGLSVEHPMTKTSAPKGSAATLQCHFDPQPEYILWFFAAGNSKAWQTLTRCHFNLKSCGSLAGTQFADARMAVNGTLEILSVDERHNGSYKCEAYRALDTALTEGWLFVSVPPGQPEITASRLQASEGEQLALTCISRGASPPASLTWSLANDGSPVGGAGATTVQVVAALGFDRTESRLTLTARAQDDGARIVCRAQHPLGNVSSEAVQLAVLYKPVLAPTGSVAVALGARVQLACSARGNPTPQVQLTRGSEALAGPAPVSVTYSLSAGSKSIAGVYRCAAQNSQGQSELPFAVDVQYGPSVSCPGSVAVKEGEPLRVDCLVDSNPGPTSVTWRRVGPSGAPFSNSARLTINATARSDAGLWRCEAVNRLLPNNSVAMEMSGSADTTIIVEYPPGQPKVVISNRRVLRGDNISLVCQANADSPGIPSPAFEWSRSTSAAPAGYPRTGPTLSLALVSLTDAGMYSCTPVNSAGRGPPGAAQLEVEQAPDWLELQPRPRVTARMNSTGEEAATAFILTCTAISKPQAEILWYKDSQAIDAGFYAVESVATFVESSYYRTRSSLVFHGAKRTGRLRPEDNGRFLCEAKNTHGKVEAVQELSVEFKPQILTTEVAIALPASGLGSVNLTCPTIGQPMPALIWLRDGVPVPGGSQTADPTESYRSTGRLDGLRQAARYSCRAENRLGSAEHIFRLVNASVPEAPSELRPSATADWDRVQLAWRPGFVGVSGEDARAGVQFWVQIRQRDRQDPSRIVMETSQRADSDSLSNVTGLFPDTNYSLAIYVVNRLGRGPLSQPALSLRTPALTLPKPSRVRVEDGGTLLVAALGGYCMRIESSDDGGTTWSLVHYCLASDKPELAGASSRLLYRVSLCLTQRPEVCGPAVLSTDVMAALPDVSTATITIVGGCCAGLILLLSMVLLYFCCRRRRHYKEMEGATQHPLLLRRRQQQQQQQQQQLRQDSPSEGSLQQGRYHTAPDGKPYALVPPHPSMSADNVTCLSGSRRSSSLVTSAIVVAKEQEAGDGDLGAGLGQPPARGGGVFATLRSGHNPLDSSASNPAIFNYSQDYPDDNRNTDPYNFESGYRQGRKIVYEVVV